MKISKLSIISIPIVYVILGYTLFQIKYTSPVDTPIQQVYIDKFINNITHLWYIKLAIALVTSIVINFIINNTTKQVK